ncbi:MAG: AbrB/MazE/SpoVT family DNA-binding domain-containing protein [Alphaproteobacteria bacterium]|nr:AbrB/MazE/SpoVT family DNA-binding domain-containing protein [Alphaproteobacteria bacterium]
MKPIRTKAFKSGNSQAIRVPADIAYADMNAELEITRTGDELRIRPARQNLKALVEKLRSLPEPAEIEIREPIEMPDRGDD